MSRPDILRLAQLPPVGSAVQPSERMVFFAETGFQSTKVYQRQDMPSGFAAFGPALIEEYGSTTLISPADSFSVGALGEIRISINANANSITSLARAHL